MDEKEPLNAVEVALCNEMREREFYLKPTERTRDQVGMATSKQIAGDAPEHYERLKELHEKGEKMEKEWL